MTENGLLVIKKMSLGYLRGWCNLLHASFSIIFFLPLIFLLLLLALLFISEVTEHLKDTSSWARSDGALNTCLMEAGAELQRSWGALGNAS